MDPDNDEFEEGGRQPPDLHRLQPDNLVDTKTIRKEVEAMIRDMSFAIDSAGLKPNSAPRFAMRILCVALRHSTVLLCKLVDEVRIVERNMECSRQEQAKEDAKTIATLTASNARYASRAIAVSVAVCLTAITIVAWVQVRAEPPSLVVDFEAGGTGLVRCGHGARDEAGNYHCAMDVVLVNKHRRP